MEAIPMEDARSKEQVRRQGSPLRKQYRQQVSNQLASSSDDDSGGLDYDTGDSALRDYMDNVVEQDQGCETSSLICCSCALPGMRCIVLRFRTSVTH